MTQDPIEHYLQADVPIRVLLEHGAQRLDWLTSLEVSPIVLSYRDASGEIVIQHVTKPELIKRAHALGWTPSEPGAAEKIVFEEGYVWVDAMAEHGAVGGIWFSHENATHWEGDAWGTPLGIPLERFAAIEQREKAAREESERMRTEIANREKMHRLAHTCFGFIKDRIKACHERSGVELSYTEAWDQVQAIAAVHGVDFFADRFFPALPWSDEDKRQLRAEFAFCEDVVSGKPVSECLVALAPKGNTQQINLEVPDGSNS